MQMDTQMEKDEDRERLLESEENNHAPHDKVERRSSFEVDEGLERRHGRKKRGGLFASIDKRYWFAFSLPALLLLIYFTTNLNSWFGSTPDLKVEFPQEQMREAELRALYLLQKQQQGLLHLWSYITINLTANAATNITPNRSLIATPNPALNTTLNATSPPSLNTTFNNKSPNSDESPNTTLNNKSLSPDESPKTTSKESPNTTSNSPENTTSNVTPSAFSNNVPSNAAFNPSISGAFVTELLSQITLNQEIQHTLLSSHQTGNVSDSEQFNVNTTLNYYGGSTSRCGKAVSNNVERKTLKWKPRHDRYLVAICLSGQMSNHLICLEKHMFFAALLNRILVLPSPKFDYQYEHSLDIQHMKDCLGSNTIMTFEEFYNKKRDHLHIDRLICYMASPPCYMDDDHVRKFKGLGWSIGKTEVAWPEDSKLKSYPSHPHSEEIVKRFSCNDEVIGIGDVFFADVEEKRVMQPGGPLAHKCKTIVKPNQYILLTAQRFIQTYLGANFIALHFRRYGFLQFCNAKEESCFFPIPQAANCILQKVQTSNAPVIYLSTDAPASETDLLQSLIMLNGRTIPLVKRPAHDARGKWDALLYRHRLHSDDQVFAMLDKTICALSSVFIGTNGSTFTDDIIRLRRDWGTASTCDEHLCHGEKPNFQADLH